MVVKEGEKKERKKKEKSGKWDMCERVDVREIRKINDSCAYE